MMRTHSTVDATGRRPARHVAVALMLIALMAVGAALRLAPTAARAETGAVTIKDFRYRPPEIKVNVGDSVTWTNQEANSKRTHTVIQDDGAWSSDGNRKNDPSAEIKPGSSFTITFDKDNVTYPYHCRLHTYMRGKVVVGKGAPEGAPPPPPATEEPAPTPTPQSGPLPPLPPP
ncbi:MAG: plastocyanin/azurin family copper-binding protein, partial [Candidatus Dormibacteria bacterium]